MYRLSTLSFFIKIVPMLTMLLYASKIEEMYFSYTISRIVRTQNNINNYNILKNVTQFPFFFYQYLLDSIFSFNEKFKSNIQIHTFLFHCLACYFLNCTMLY